MLVVVVSCKSLAGLFRDPTSRLTGLDPHEIGVPEVVQHRVRVILIGAAGPSGLDRYASVQGVGALVDNTLPHQTSCHWQLRFLHVTAKDIQKAGVRFSLSLSTCLPREVGHLEARPRIRESGHQNSGGAPSFTSLARRNPLNANTLRINDTRSSTNLGIEGCIGRCRWKDGKT